LELQEIPWWLAQAVADAVFVICFATISLELQEIGILSKGAICEIIYEPVTVVVRPLATSFAGFGIERLHRDQRTRGQSLRLHSQVVGHLLQTALSVGAQCQGRERNSRQNHTLHLYP
jgi:hypothetical protein